jgi:WD40 repeat protein
METLEKIKYNYNLFSNDKKEKNWLDMKDHRTFNEHSLKVNCIALNPINPKEFASASDDNLIIIWNINSFKPTYILKAHKDNVNHI